MITLKTDAICETCPKFDAQTETSTLYAENQPVSVVHEITCSRKIECENIRRFMEQALAGEGKKKASDA
ncbi:MAG: hypothetical protein NC084_12370 [Bacteroides sp.]|nr:hypothetical protein [Eubacterium sp.]MCM1419121.1 hypothetical protein [Roseburia sp.]MCM1463487.1 hypothetical protein [Bacteroides sp.]